MRRRIKGFGVWVVAVAVCLGVAAAQAVAQEAAQTPAAAAASATPVPAAQANPIPAPAQAKAETKALSASASKDGFVLQSESADFKIRIGGYAQADSRFYLSDDAGTQTDSFLLRRVRPIVQGTVSKYFDFYINPDFGDGKAVLYDAYVDVRYASWLKFRFGKTKPPLGLERLQSGAALMFIERALPTAIAPNRDVGIMLHGELAKGVVGYAIGVFNGSLDGGSIDGDSNDSKDVVGRLFLRPFKTSPAKALSGLTVAIAASNGRQKGTLPSFKSGGQQTFFSYDSKASADGTRTRWSAQASWYAGPVGFLGEYVRSQQDVRKDAAAGRIANGAWQLAGSIVVTGEAASANGVKPRTPFDPAKHTWGAIEIAARWNVLDIDDAVFDLKLADATAVSSRASAWAIGINWYLSQNFKYVVNYERTSYKGGAKTGDRPGEGALILRAQVSY